MIIGFSAYLKLDIVPAENFRVPRPNPSGLVLLAASFFPEFAICQANNVCQVAVNRWQHNYVIILYIVRQDPYFTYMSILRVFIDIHPKYRPPNYLERVRKWNAVVQRHKIATLGNRKCFVTYYKWYKCYICKLLLPPMFSRHVCHPAIATLPPGSGRCCCRCQQH